jgi:hypothetical protein
MGEDSKAPVTSFDLLTVSSDNIKSLVDGDRSPAVANAIVANVAVMLRITKMQMEYAKMTGKTPDIPLLLTSGDK